MLGIGNGSVFKLVLEHFPAQTGKVVDIIGALGGIGDLPATRHGRNKTVDRNVPGRFVTPCRLCSRRSASGLFRT